MPVPSHGPSLVSSTLGCGMRRIHGNDSLRTAHEVGRAPAAALPTCPGEPPGLPPREELRVILHAQMVGGKLRAASLSAKCILASTRLLTGLLWPESRLVARKWAWWQRACSRARACIGFRLFRSAVVRLCSLAAFPPHGFSRLQNSGADRTCLLDWTRGHGVQCLPCRKAKMGQLRVRQAVGILSVSLWEPQLPHLSKGRNYSRYQQSSPGARQCSRRSMT